MRGPFLKPGHNRLLLLALFLAGLVLAGRFVYHRLTHVVIDDARVDGNVITVSSLASGKVIELPVIEGDHVQAGQLLVRVDARDAELQRDVLRARLQTIESQMEVVKAQGGQIDQETLGRYEGETHRLHAAEAEVAAAEAQVAQARADLTRSQQLTEQEWMSPQALERVRTDFRRVVENHRKAVAELAAAHAALSSAGGTRRQLQVVLRQLAVLRRQAEEMRAEIRRQDREIGDRTIFSPANGAVVMTFVHPGEHVSAGQRILMFHDPASIWVEANVKETDVARLELGMAARVRVDAFPDDVIAGEIQRIGLAATNKFALLPSVNPSGNFTRITQRLPVRIRITGGSRSLRPGMLVEVDVDTRNH